MTRSCFPINRALDDPFRPAPAGTGVEPASVPVPRTHRCARVASTVVVYGLVSVEADRAGIDSGACV